MAMLFSEEAANEPARYLRGGLCRDAVRADDCRADVVGVEGLRVRHPRHRCRRFRPRLFRREVRMIFNILVWTALVALVIAILYACTDDRKRRWHRYWEDERRRERESKQS